MIGLYETIISDNKVQQMFELNWKHPIVAGMIGASMLATPAMAKDMTRDTRTIEQNVSDSNIVAKVIAGEAAGEGNEGMLAVACVIQNRGGNPIGIVTQPKQFSAYSDKDLMNRNYSQVKVKADDLAERIGTLKDITGGATHYVTKELYNRKKNNPNSWISKMKVTGIIGNHIFMREKERG